MNNYRAVFIFALVPGIISALVFFFFVKDSPLSEAKTKRPLNWSVLKRFPRAYWDVIITTFIMKLSHFGNGLLLVRGNELGISSAFIPLLIVIIYFVTFCTAYPVGLLCDRFDQKKVYIWGLFFMCCSHFLLGWSSHIGGYIGGIIFWGAYQGVIQTSLSSMISRVSPKNLRGTGFGIFRLTIGLGTLMSNVVAGTLWDFFGATFSFVSAGLFIFVFATALFTRSLRGPFSLFVLRYSSKK